MQFDAKSIAEYLGGIVEGNPDVKVTSPARIEYGKEGNLCFLANPKYEKYLYTTNASAVLVNKNFELKHPVNTTLIRVDNAYESIAKMLAVFENLKSSSRKGREYPSHVSWRSKRGKRCYIGAYSYISNGVKIGNNVKIYPQVYIAPNVKIGDNTIIFAGVKIYNDCIIGKDCIIHAGAVIGSDGFGFAPQEEGSYRKIPQTGNVIIEDNVEIGANSTIDRATMGSTIIGKGTKIDNLVQIAHNVEMGQNNVIAAQVGIAGSVKIGNNCMLGGQAGIVGHLTVGNNVILAAKAGISKNVNDGLSMLGFPAMEASAYKRSYAVFRNLPKLREEVTELVKKSNG